MISTIITAGGISRRFGSNKLLELIEGKSVIERTILKFIDYSDEIVIPTSPETEDFIKTLEIFDPKKIFFAPFGKTRQKSVYNALCTLKFHDYVLIHDGARPYVSKTTIETAIKEVKAKNALCTGVYATDTIKITDENGCIKETIDRERVFQAQTPQAFKYDLIMDAHKKFAQRDDFTDDSSLVEALGVPVYVLCADSVNKKITTRADL